MGFKDSGNWETGLQRSTAGSRAQGGQGDELRLRTRKRDCLRGAAHCKPGSETPATRGQRRISPADQIGARGFCTFERCTNVSNRAGHRKPPRPEGGFDAVLIKVMPGVGQRLHLDRLPEVATLSTSSTFLREGHLKIGFITVLSSDSLGGRWGSNAHQQWACFAFTGSQRAGAFRLSSVASLG